MDELHTLALDVARRVIESRDEDPAIVDIARLLLEEAARTAAPGTLNLPRRDDPAANPGSGASI